MRKICKETGMAAATMADTTEVRLARLESDVAHIRSDVANLKSDIRDVRQEMRDGFVAMHNEFGEFRKELGEFRKGLGELHKEVAANGKAILRGDLMTRIWMLLLCAAMLGVMARGLHWI
jgi:hypothetical protein